MATSNTTDCFREIIGLKVQGLLFNALPVNRPDLQPGNKTIVFEDGTGLTISSNGSYWRESRQDIELAARQRRKELDALERETREVLALAGQLRQNRPQQSSDTEEPAIGPLPTRLRLRFRCPDTIRTEDPDDEVIGCGKIFVATWGDTYWNESLHVVDCPHCGIHFDPFDPADPGCIVTEAAP